MIQVSANKLISIADFNDGGSSFINSVYNYAININSSNSSWNMKKYK